jgi:hypothetical protein
VGGGIAILVTGLLWRGDAVPASVPDRVPVGEIARDLDALVAPARRLQLRFDASLTASLPRRGDRAGISRVGPLNTPVC